MTSSGQDTDTATMNSQLRVSAQGLYKTGPNSQHGWRRRSPEAISDKKNIHYGQI